MKNSRSCRLSDDVLPKRYELNLAPNFEDFSFKGEVSIALQIKKPTKSLVLHAVDIKVTKAELFVGSIRFKPTSISYQKKAQTVRFDFGEELKSGRASFRIAFKGTLNKGMSGLYRTSYTVQGEKRWGCATQFEATDARRAFPCFDEPDKKAEFWLSLEVPGHMTALSNMPIVYESKSSNDPNKKVVDYGSVPPMSTYLLACVVAELECVEGKTERGIPVRVWTTPGKKAHGQFALDVALHTLKYFEEWYGIPYALPKVDMVALPDFAAGAMENWGLITYRETALLSDPDKPSRAVMQRVAEVVNHELAHQWFGNLVTMKWWSDLWLNEGFASFMGPMAVDHQFPDWNIWTQHVAGEYLSALHEDSLKNTHPIEVAVNDPEEIREVFDGITYSKGSVVNRMLEHFLGDDFRKGLNHYLTEHRFGNATTKDLWAALEKISKKPVRAIMARYTEQPGYPVLKVNGEQHGDKLTLQLEQERFFLDGRKDRDNSLWKIPIGVLTPGLRPDFTYMGRRRMTISVLASASDWVKLNPEQSGFYRVAYSDDLFDRIVRAIRSEKLGAIDRLGFLDDTFALARAGYISTPCAFTALSAYSQEKDYSVWQVIAGAWNSIEQIFGESETCVAIETLAQGFFGSILDRCGWDKKPDDGHLDILLRSLAIRNAGGFGDSDAICEAKKRFEGFVAGGELDPDIRGAVYALVAENGGLREFDSLVKLYDAADFHEEKIRVIRALGSFKNQEVLKAALVLGLSEKMRKQDLPILVIGMSGHKAARETAWNFVKENWKTLLERYENGGLTLLQYFVEVPSGFADAAHLEDVKLFFKTNRIPGAKRTIRQVLERISSNIAWRERDAKAVSDWLHSSA